jgi:hypothetical protein
MSPVHVNGMPAEVSRPSPQHGAMPISVPKRNCGTWQLKAPASSSCRATTSWSARGRAQRPLQRLALRDVLLERPAVAHLSLERLDPRLVDAPVRTDDLVRVDRDDRHPGRAAQGVLVHVNVKVALDRSPIRPIRARPIAARDAGDPERSCDASRRGAVRESAEHELERSAPSGEQVRQHRRPDGRALRRDAAVVEAAGLQSRLVERPDDDGQPRSASRNASAQAGGTAIDWMTSTASNDASRWFVPP